MNYQILPDTEGEIREVQLINLQGSSSSSLEGWSIDDLRALLRMLWPSAPEHYELLPDAHCKIIDFADERRTYYVNVSMVKELWLIDRFLKRFIEFAGQDHSGIHSLEIPFKLEAMLRRLGVALESPEDRAWRIKEISERSTSKDQASLH